MITQTNCQTIVLKTLLVIFSYVFINPIGASQGLFSQNVDTLQTVVTPKKLSIKLDTHVDPTLLALFNNTTHRHIQKEPVLFLNTYLSDQEDFAEHIIQTIQQLRVKQINPSFALGLDEDLESLLPLIIYWALMQESTSKSRLIQKPFQNEFIHKDLAHTPVEHLNMLLYQLLHLNTLFETKPLPKHVQGSIKWLE